jgi:hypothetical protein
LMSSELIFVFRDWKKNRLTEQPLLAWPLSSVPSGRCSRSYGGKTAVRQEAFAGNADKGSGCIFRVQTRWVSQTIVFQYSFPMWNRG